MARKVRDGAEAATEAAYSSEAGHGATEMIDNSMELVDPAPLIGDATRVAGEERPHIAPPPKFRVMRATPVTVNGFRTQFREGKIVDGAQYNLDSLRAQGVILQEWV